MSYTRQQIEMAVKAKGYKYFENGELNLNIIGIRNSATGQKVTNKFDDHLALVYKEKGEWQFHIWSITTDNGGGTARVKPGQYPGSHHIGLHQGKYECLKQKAPLTVFRDLTNDGIYQEDKTETGVFGINIHKAGVDSQDVNSWSHGCQVFKRIADFDKFLAICKRAKAIQGDSFTYTLIQSKDIVTDGTKA
jgi:hypothetical protein